jgi:excisionase family DNA binding protein
MTVPTNSPLVLGNASASLMTAADVARLLRISLRTVRRHIRSGELSVLRIGRAVRISPEALSAFLSAQARR